MPSCRDVLVLFGTYDGEKAECLFEYTQKLSKWAGKFGNPFRRSAVCSGPPQERLHAEYGCWCNGVWCNGAWCNVKHLYILLKANCGGS